MSSYSITITTDEATNASTTLRANVGTNGRILELIVRANGPEGFTPEELPAFDLRRLISAVILAVPGSTVLEAAPVAEALPAVEYVTAPGPRKAAGRRARKSTERATAEGTTGRRRVAGRRAARNAASPGDERQAGARGRRAAKAAKATAAKATAGKPERQTRAYRRMPDDIVAVFQQSGGVTRTAEHYGVPRHTAQGWIRRLRMQGDLPS